MPEYAFELKSRTQIRCTEHRVPHTPGGLAIKQPHQDVGPDAVAV